MTLRQRAFERKQGEDEIELLTAEVEGANAANREFLARMSHDLRTPLNAIIGFAQLLERDSLTEKQAESVGQILRAGGQLLSLVDEIGDRAQIEPGRR
jgi:signal transduction histidine kinase